MEIQSRAQTRSRSGIRAAGLSDAGCSRERNEDAFALYPECDLYVVSDGIGGEPHGDTAARIVVRALPELLCEQPSEAEQTEAARAALMRAAVARLSRVMHREASRLEGSIGMGATVVLAAFHGEQATIAHMGDSRAYLFSDGSLMRLTSDHSIAGILLEHGEITEEQARDHPGRGQITRYVGMPDGVDADVTTTQVGRGDRLLLCSDGLHGVVSEDRIALTLAQRDGDAADACRRLVDAALDAGAPDNVTVLVAERDDASGSSST